jgi:hypothetical protein
LSGCAHAPSITGMRSSPAARRWQRAWAAAIVAGTALVGTTAESEARTIADFWQVSVQMPPQLWEDGASLPFMMGDAIDEFTARGNRYRIRWVNSSNSQLPKYMIQQQAAPYGISTAGLYDRPLTPAQLARNGLKQRLLWLDADVLVARGDSPACAGVSTAQLDGLLTGKVTDWRTVFPAWPADLDSAVRLAVPVDRTGAYRWGFGRQKFPLSSTRTDDAGSLRVSGGQVGIQKLSFVERLLAPSGLCAVPVDGVTPTEQTTRSGTYPRAYGVYYVSRIHPSKGAGGKPPELIARWEALLFGPMGDAYLTTAMGRVRYLPG